MLWQFTLNGLVAAAIQIPLALACAIVYCVGGFFDFSLGASLIGAAYFVFFLIQICHFPLLLALTGGVFAGAVLEYLVRITIYSPLQSRRANHLLLLLASLGFYIAFQNGIALIAGDSGRFLQPGVVGAGLEIFGGRITQTQMVTVLFSIALAISLEILQSRTQGGRILKAVANDPQLADTLGIRSKLWVSAGHAIAGGLAGLTGVFWALNVDFSPAIGMNSFMLATKICVIRMRVLSVPASANNRSIVARIWAV